MFDSSGSLWGTLFDSDTEININKSLPSVSWSTGYTRKFDSILPYNRDAYSGWELGGAYLLDDILSDVKQTPILSGGLKLGFNLGDSIVYIDGGGAFANILPQDLLEGYYVGGGFEYLFKENIGATFSFRHYHFAANEQFGGGISENNGNELTQAQFGLVYYLRKKQIF